MKSQLNNILLITCSSGHGHTVATYNIQEELKQTHPDAVIHTIDTVDYMYPVKPFVVDFLNAGIRHDSTIAHTIASGIGIYEFFYGYLFGYPLARDLHALFGQHAIDTVIDTQPVFTPFLLKQIASASRQAVAYHKVLTDLPANKTHPCFSGIRKRKQFNNIEFLVHSNPPLAHGALTEENFWKTHCHLNGTQIQSHWSKPVHPAFKSVPKYLNEISVEIYPQLAQHLGFASNTTITLPTDARVTTLMMGSQGLDAIEQYVEQIEQQLGNRVLGVPHYYFIACSKNEQLFKQLLEKCLSHPAESHLKIIPLEMQSSEHVASMMWRSQSILLRASGLSCMEQLAMDEAAKNAGIAFNPKRYLHSHCKRPVPAGLTEAEQSQYLLTHSIGYEKGNAMYVCEKLGTMMTRPDMFKVQ